MLALLASSYPPGWEAAGGTLLAVLALIVLVGLLRALRPRRPAPPRRPARQSSDADWIVPMVVVEADEE